MEGLVATLLVLTLVVHASSLAIKSGESESKRVNENVLERKLENDASQLYDMDELRKSYGMLLDNMVTGRNHPFGWGIRRYKYDHPFGYGRFGQGDAKYRDHPFGFAVSRSRDHPFGFGTRRLHGKKRDYVPSNTKAFHGKRDMGVGEEDSSLDEQNTSLFHGKRNEDLVSQWLDDKIIQGNLKK